MNGIKSILGILSIQRYKKKEQNLLKLMLLMK